MADGPDLTYPVQAAYFLQPRGLLHFGTHPGDLRQGGAFPASDTLFGALAWAYRTRFSAAAFEAWLGAYAEGEPRVLWTSALPALDVPGDGLHVLVPLPLRRPARAQQQEDEDRKLLRRVRYLHPRLLPWLREGATAGVDVDKEEVGAALLPRALAEQVRQATTRREGGEAQPLWATGAQPRVTVDRASGASSLFGAKYARFSRTAPGAVQLGLAIGVLAHQDADLDWLDACLDVLAEAGIGGERSTGCGQFDWTRRACPLPLTARPEGPLLSLCWPRQQERQDGALHLDDSRGYRLAERMGWVCSPDWNGSRTRAVTMLAEGSYLAPHLPAPVGGLALVTPDPADATRHPVYRYGYGCFLQEGAP